MFTETYLTFSMPHNHLHTHHIHKLGAPDFWIPAREWAIVVGFFTRSLRTPKADLHYKSSLQVSRQSTIGVFIFRRVQEGHHSKPVITRERRHFSKIHESDCKPSTCLSCSYLSWHIEVSTVPCSTREWTNEWVSEWHTIVYTTTV